MNKTIYLVSEYFLSTDNNMPIIAFYTEEDAKTYCLKDKDLFITEIQLHESIESLKEMGIEEFKLHETKHMKIQPAALSEDEKQTLKEINEQDDE